MGHLKRVVVTGLGMVSPIACGVEATWRRLLASESGVAEVENFDVSDLPCKVAAQVPHGSGPDAFNPDDWMDPKEQRRVDDFIIYGMSAATQALHDASWSPKSYEEEIETGVLFGSGIGGLGGIYDASVTLHEKGPRRISPFFIPGRLINLLSGQVSIAHNLKGPNHAVVTACSTGAHPIGEEIELHAVERLLGNSAAKATMSSTKSATGHLLGAAGAVEAIFSVLAIRDQVAPPTLNLDNPSVEPAIHLAPHVPRKRPIHAGLSNSFGFGGTNASLVFSALNGPADF